MRADEILLLGMDIWDQLGLRIEGLPVDFPDGVAPEKHIETAGGSFDMHATDSKLSSARNYTDTLWPQEHRAPQKVREPIMKAIQPLLDENAAIPTDAFCTHPLAEVSIDVPDDEPVSRKQYPIPFASWPAVDEQIAGWVTDQRVSRAPPESLWNSPLLPANKKDLFGFLTKVRVCLDPTALNKLFKDSPRLLPNIYQ